MDESITEWIAAAKNGDSNAQARIWYAYAQRLAGLARQRLKQSPSRAADEEDIVVSVMDSFFRRAERGEFSDIHNRGDLWGLLAKITSRKAINEFNKQQTQRRGGNRVRNESSINHGEDATSPLELIAEYSVTPEDVDDFLAQCEHLLNQLANDELRLVARRRLEGYTNREIAEEINKSQTSVENKLKIIRKTWELER